MGHPNIIDLAATDIPAVDLIGTKARHLAKIRSLGFPTPDAFVLTTAFYHRTVRSGRIEQQLEEIWHAACDARPQRVQMLARKARHLISGLRFDQELTDEVIRRIDCFGANTAVAVRSSLPRDAISGPEGPGIHASYTNLNEPDQILSRIRRCWASLFGERALMLRARGLGDAQPSMAVIVQPMVDALKSGIAVPLGPQNEVLVEATFGLGDPIVMGAVEPDSYVFDTHTGIVRSKTVSRKQIVLHPNKPLGHTFASVDQELIPVLDDAETRSVAGLCTDVAREVGGPHEIEWAIAEDGLSVLQIRPVETGGPDNSLATDQAAGRLSGLGVGLGSSSGPARIVRCDNDVAAVEIGDVIVAVNTVPRWRPYLLRAAAIVTETGDDHSHAGRIAREYGIPAVVGTSTATADLVDGVTLTVDAQRGIVGPKSSD